MGVSILPLVCLRNLGQKLRIVAKSVGFLGAIAWSKDDLSGFELDARLAAHIPELLHSGCEFDFRVPEGVSGIDVLLQEVPTLASSDLVIGHNGDPGQFLAFEGHHNLSGAGAEQAVLAHQRVPSGLDNVCEGNTAVVVQLRKELTRPKAEDRDLLKDPSKLGEIRAEAYDIVLNGVEIGGGSIRIHEGDLQAETFSVLGINDVEQEELFGHLLRAFRHGAPPHGGIALGLDRLVALIAGEESIREVIAFPKNNRGAELLTGSPAPAEIKQLRELHISSTVKPKQTVVPGAPASGVVAP